MGDKIRNFTDLDAWKSSHLLAVAIYRATESFPKSEFFGLTSQMRRSAVSVASNLAEGFGRRTKADKVRFYTMATGSLSELQSQMIIAKDLGYLPEETFQKNWSMSISAYRLTNGLIASADKALF